MVKISFPLTEKHHITEAVNTISLEMKALQSELKILQTMLSQVRQYCKHEGQVTGFNDRDGSWGNPCPTCGHSF